MNKSLKKISFWTIVVKLLCFALIYSFLSFSPNALTSPSTTLSLEIDTSYWFTNISKYNSNYFLNVYLFVKGKSNAKLVGVDTFGDGLNGEKMLIKDGNEFKDTIRICFIPIIITADTILRKIHPFSTNITAYELDTLKVYPYLRFPLAGPYETIELKSDSLQIYYIKQ
jgi:hypothetical protein